VRTVQFFNSREAQRSTPERAQAKKQFYQFVNEKEAKGIPSITAYNSTAREYPELAAVMAGGGKVQFINAPGDGSAPVGSPGFNRIFYLPATATQEQFAAAWKGNGSVSCPINPAKVFAALVDLEQTKNGTDYDAALTKTKSAFPELWAAVELLRAGLTAYKTPQTTD
jgi:hypothetical protein